MSWASWGRSWGASWGISWGRSTAEPVICPKYTIEYAEYTTKITEMKMETIIYRDNYTAILRKDGCDV